MNDEPAIYAVGLCCPLGRTLTDASDAYAKGCKVMRKDRTLFGIDGLPQIMACALPFAEEPDFTTRLDWLLRTALEDCMAQVEPPEEGWPLHVLVQPWLKGHAILAALKQRLQSDWPHGVSGLTFGFGAQAEGLTLLSARAQVVAEGRARAMLVCALDSYIHPDLWLRLGLQSRLVADGNPYGFIPGEAACVVLVATPAAMTGAEAPASPTYAPKAWGRLLAAFDAVESEDPDQPRGLIGRAMGNSVRRAMQAGKPGRLLTDLNGERWRAEEFGFAASAGSDAAGDLFASPESPALQMGFSGAAAGLVLLALALSPGTAKPGGEVAMLTASSRNTGLRCAALLARADR